MNFIDVEQIEETTSASHAAKLAAQGWVTLAVAPGQDEDHRPYHLYSMGKLRTQA